MNQSSITSSSSQVVVKAPTTLDKIPEDVQLAIIKFIQSWKRSEGTEEEREKGKRVRDSALRAVALSCRKLQSVYRAELLSDVTLDNLSLLSFYLALTRDRESGTLVRSVTFTRRDASQHTQEKMDKARKDFREIYKAIRAQGFGSDRTVTPECIVEAVYRFLSNIQTLIIHYPDFNIPLRSKLANARPPPLPFLTQSLKKLFIPMWVDVEDNLKARNVVWILVFCTGLRFAALGCVFDQNDFKYLAEFSDSFSGLSNVLKLSLGSNFEATKSIQRYWDRSVGKEWVGKNKKTQAIYYLLKVTKNLQCLELNDLPSLPNGDTSINPGCLIALRNSYLFLESLRLFNIGVDRDDPEEHIKANTNFAMFQKLRVISVDATMMVVFSRFLGTRLPHGLKILSMPYYNIQAIQEDTELARALKVRSFPSLQAVVVPSKAIAKDGTQADSDGYKKGWREGRRELEKAEIFTSGKVKLRLLELGESIGEPSEIDFMSTLTWLSPP